MQVTMKVQLLIITRVNTSIEHSDRLKSITFMTAVIQTKTSIEVIGSIKTEYAMIAISVMHEYHLFTDIEK